MSQNKWDEINLMIQEVIIKMDKFFFYKILNETEIKNEWYYTICQHNDQNDLVKINHHNL